jgi:transketolase
MSADAQIPANVFDCRDAYVKTLEALAGSDPRIVAVCNDSVGSSKLGKFRERFPDRLINVGIAEQNMIGVGAGLANGGKIPFVSGASCFLTGRALEQVKADVAYSRANVKLCGISSGVAYGELGPTHHSIEDMAWLRPLTNLTILVPSDPWETAEAIKYAAEIEGPVFIRISRMPVPALDRGPDPVFKVGKAEVLRAGDDLTLIANGVMVHRALSAANALAAQGIQARVVNMSSIAPFDEDAVFEASKTGGIVTVEEHNIRGGLGGAVAEFVATHNPCAMRILGFPGFAPTGSAEWLLEHFNLTSHGIASAARELLTARKS